MTLRRKIMFTIAALIIFLLIVEFGSRIIERNFHADPVDARSPLPFQQLPDPNEALHEPSIQSPNTNILTFSEWNNPSIPFEKKENEIRILFLGGSAMLGAGVPMTVSFCGTIERLLCALYPEKKFRIYNLARTGNASPQMAQILARTIDVISPDLVVTVMGNNEYLDAIALFGNQEERFLSFSFSRWLQHRFAFARLMRPELKPIQSDSIPKDIPSLKRSQQIDNYILDRLDRSLTSIALTTKKAGAKLLTCTMSVNLLDSGIFGWELPINNGVVPKEYYLAFWALLIDNPQGAIDAMNARLTTAPKETSATLIRAIAQIRAGKKDEGISACNEIVSRFEKKPFGDLTQKQTQLLIRAYREVHGIKKTIAKVNQWQKANPDIAIEHLASLQYVAGNYDKAKEMYQRLILQEERPIKASLNINNVIAATTKRMGGDNFDLAGKIEGLADNHFPDFGLFKDHCHYNPKGHMMVAHLLGQAISNSLGLDQKIPDAAKAIHDYKDGYKTRGQDFYQLDKWGGADFYLSRLVDPVMDRNDTSAKELKERMAKSEPDAQTLVFLGNWELNLGSRNRHGARVAAMESYKKALEVDPNFIAAQSNIDLLKIFWKP